MIPLSMVASYTHARGVTEEKFCKAAFYPVASYTHARGETPS